MSAVSNRALQKRDGADGQHQRPPAAVPTLGTPDRQPGARKRMRPPLDGLHQLHGPSREGASTTWRAAARPSFRSAGLHPYAEHRLDTRQEEEQERRAALENANAFLVHRGQPAPYVALILLHRHKGGMRGHYTPSALGISIGVDMTGSSIPRKENLTNGMSDGTAASLPAYLRTPGFASSRNFIDLATGFPSLSS